MNHDRIPIIAANWKMHKTLEEVEEFFKDFLAGLKGIDNRVVVIAPSFVAISRACQLSQGSPVQIAGQNMYFEEKGAFTGEISGPMLKSAGAEWVILGHSERRHIFGENDELIARKVRSALDHVLKPILCIGETLNERESNLTEEILSRQLTEGLKPLKNEEILEVSIAYEPVWAIGTGQTATLAQIQRAHRLVRKRISERAGEAVAQQIRILYGGSVKPENVESIMNLEDVDGALVGGASLYAESFLRIVKFEEN